MAHRPLFITVLLSGLIVLAAGVGIANSGLNRLWSRSTSLPAPQPAAVAEAIVRPAEPLSQGLDPNEREFLWDIEHHGNLLNKFGFKPLSDALARADVQELVECPLRAGVPT
jgi:hypothetical protein